MLKCVFIGYSSTKKGYKCYHPIPRKVSFLWMSLLLKTLSFSLILILSLLDLPNPSLTSIPDTASSTVIKSTPMVVGTSIFENKDEKNGNLTVVPL